MGKRKRVYTKCSALGRKGAGYVGKEEKCIK